MVVAFFLGFGVGGLAAASVGTWAFNQARKLAAVWEKTADDQQALADRWRDLYQQANANCDGYELLYLDAKARLEDR